MADELRTPVIVADTSPFRLIPLAEKDSWNASQGEVSDRRYDYVKLNRTTTAIDVGISPFSVIVGYDCSLLLPALDRYRDPYAALDVFNRAATGLMLGGVYIEAIGPAHLTRGVLYGNGYCRVHASGESAQSRLHFAFRTRMASILDVIHLYEPQQVQAKELTEAHALGSRVLSFAETLTPLVFLSGITSFAHNERPNALVSMWTSIEQALEQKWQTGVVGPAKQLKIPGRAQVLDDDRVWALTNRLELLFQAGLLAQADYGLLLAARRARNKLIHDGRTPAAEEVDATFGALWGVLESLVPDAECRAALLSGRDRVLEHRRNREVPAHGTAIPEDQMKGWIPLDPLPGEPGWGPREYERIPEIELKRVDRAAE